MAVVAVSMVRDELDVIEGFIRHAADEVDFMLVADNGSVDGTRDVLDKLARELPLTVIDDPERAHYQSRKVSALAEQAAEMGATWIVPMDADELWIAEDRLRTVLPELDANVAEARLFNHFPSAVDPEGDDPFRAIVWRQAEPMALRKVAFRWEPGAVVHDGNHGVTLPNGSVSALVLEVRHFPYRTAEQFVRKARNGAEALRATDLPETTGAHWRAYGDLMDRFGEQVLHEVFAEHFWNLSPVDAGLVLDPAPYRRWETVDG